MEVTNITKEEVVPIESPLHLHPLTPFTRFDLSWCEGCYSLSEDVHRSISAKQPGWSYIYGGYRCNEPGCERAVFHKECAKPLPEINHSSHPDHPLKLIILNREPPSCSLCEDTFEVGYSCSICDFKLDLVCAMRQDPIFIPENSYGHEHPVDLFSTSGKTHGEKCKACDFEVDYYEYFYRCHPCKFFIHLDCVDFTPEAYHTSHPQHPLKSIRCQVPDYADKKCLLCEKMFDQRHHQLHHCDVCNFSICRRCVKNPPPVSVESWRTHEHQLHLVPRRIHFTCNACGMQGDRSPYFCLPCNFMIHRECIGLPRVININRHDHRISYTPRLGDGEWKCKVCRTKVDGFYGAYTCSKCPSFAVHARCATTEDVWDKIELEGTPEEEIIAPYEVIDENTIKHFCHDHNLHFYKSGMMLSESTLCVACVFQICSEPFYKCEECDFILHETCANLPRKKRHMRYNLPFTLRTDIEITQCSFCFQYFNGFRYEAGTNVTLDVRCASISDSLEHESHHTHPLYYYSTSNGKRCSRCGDKRDFVFRCDECDYILDGKCALLPKKVMRNRYDDHPLFLSYGDMNVDEKYWCEACETKVSPKFGFYTCNDCGIVLHISCVVGDFSYIKPVLFVACYIQYPKQYAEIAPLHKEINIFSADYKVVHNTSICRPLCSGCDSRCKLPSIIEGSKDGVDKYICSLECRFKLGEF